MTAHTPRHLPRYLGHTLRRLAALLLVAAMLLPSAPAALAQEQEEPAAPAAVSFPGSYATALGGQEWQPADPTVQAADPAGDDTWTLTVALPAGDYAFKVAIDGGWDENYGIDGQPGGDNVPFTVPAGGGDVTFTYVREGNQVTVNVAPPTQAAEPPAARGDGQFVRSAILHDSRQDRYRNPGGAQPFNTDVTLRLRTAANDVETVALVVNSLADNSGVSLPMRKAVSDGQYDWWEVVFNTGPAVNVHNYAFAITDGGATVYYADDGALDGGPGALSTSASTDTQGWDIYTYTPGFTAPAWAQNATIYQVFPDRFRNGDPANDPTAEDWFYPDERGHAFPVTPWNTIVPDPVPEDPAQNPAWYGTFSSTFYGGDLQGVREQLDYLQALGVDTLYFNPIFDSPSNHRYDGRDYRQVDEDLGVRGDAAASNQLFTELAAEAQRRGMHMILDGVPNHTSSDSPFFDRYARHDLVGACEDENSPYRDWYLFTPARPAGTGVCAGDTNYAAWAGYATLPQVDTQNEAVVENWLGPDGIVPTWLRMPGVDGWRIDVVPDVVLVNPQFFELMRTAAKEANPDALLISETWKEPDARLRVLGDEFDSSMNYRFRQAVLGFLRDTPFSDGDGTIDPLTPSQFEAALRAVQEDYPPAAFATAMNLVSSHDVNRAVLVLDKDSVNAERTAPVDDFVDGRHRLGLAAALQFTLPGAPTVYYGDEVGLAGFGSDPQRDDPYNRQPYPWPDQPGYDDLPAWRTQDTALLALYQQLGTLRREHSFLRTGSWDTLAISDTVGLYAYGRKDDSGAAVVVFNRSSEPLTTTLDLAGYVPADVDLARVPVSVTGEARSEPATRNEDGTVTLVVPPLDFGIWLTPVGTSMAAPGTPSVTATEGNRQLSLAIEAGGPETSTGTLTPTEYVVLRSLVDGGFTEVGRFPAEPGVVFADPEVTNATTYYYQVQAIGPNGLRSAPAATGALVPHAPVLSITLDEPRIIQQTLSAIEPSRVVKAAVVAPGITEIAGAGSGLRVQVGWQPADGGEFTWMDAQYETDNEGGANVYSGRMLPDAAGDYIFAWRASTTGGRDWTVSDETGKMTVYPGQDTEAPKPPFRLDEVARSGSQLAFTWRVSRPADLYGFRICRADVTAGETGCAVRVDLPKQASVYTDTAVTTGNTYAYTVQTVDTGFNVSEPSEPITLTAELSMVDVTWRVRVPDATPPDDLVFIAGDDAGVFGAAFNPSFQPMNPVADTPAGGNVWEWQATVKEGTKLQYKYTRGSWETVEQWGAISGYGNRQLEIVAGEGNTMLVEDTATDWGAGGPDDRRAVQAWRDPLVASTEPAQDAVGPVAAITVEFSILVTAADPAKVIVVATADGAPVAGSVVGAGGSRFTFTPDAPFAPGEYVATVFNVEQTAPMAAPYTLRFTVQP